MKQLLITFSFFFCISNSFSQTKTTKPAVNKPKTTAGKSKFISSKSKPVAAKPKSTKVSSSETAHSPILSQSKYPEMVCIDGGTFTMGQKWVYGAGISGDEDPPHQVTLPKYCIGKYEITQIQWLGIMGRNPSDFKGCPTCPIEQISWNEIQKFITKLNALTGKNYRLPTEAEWQFAAQGGNLSKGYKYSGDTAVSNVAWYCENNCKTTKPVGSKQPNELGIYDMSGNAVELCSDWYDKDYYEKSPTENPKGPAEGTAKVMRGGSWEDHEDRCRVSKRDKVTLDERCYHAGFRLAMDAE